GDVSKRNMKMNQKSTTDDRKISQPEQRKRESGQPGGGQGRRDEIEKSGVYPVSALEEASPEAMVHGEASWGQGDRGAAGYEDSGGSELIYLGEDLGVIGGGSEGESGAYRRVDEPEGETVMKCKHIMTKETVCCLPGDKVEEAGQLMKDEFIGLVLVVGDQATKRLDAIVT